MLTIAVLIALPEEYDVFGKVFPFTQDVSQGRSICLEHASGNDEVRLVSILAEQMGSQSASVSADVAITHFNPDLVVVLGIAGGVTNDLAVGDVCVSNEIIDVLHNNKVVDSEGKAEFAFAPDFYNVNADLVASFAFLKVHPAHKVDYEGWQKECAEKGLEAGVYTANQRAPLMLIGPIACGPVSASSIFNAKLQALHRKVAALETESGGVFQRITAAHIPVIALRGISDMADANKATLEAQTAGSARKVAMESACYLLKLQLRNDRFLAVAKDHALRSPARQADLFNSEHTHINVVAELEREVKSRLKELSPDFRARPEGFYLPVPRAKRISYTEDMADDNDVSPENLIDCLRAHDRIIVRLPRSFPSQSLGWTLAHSLLRQQIDNRVMLPFVVPGSDVRPPKAGLLSAVPQHLQEASNTQEFSRVFIIEEPCFESRSRLKFLTEELGKTDAKILVLTKAEDNLASIDAFVKENGLVEFDLAPVSFSETAFFLERAFDMTAREAEAVAIRLDDTFRKFRLDAHPTYFAGLQEETISALINANKRAELIQLAVDGLLTLIVAADQSKPNLSRTTRERFLKLIVLTVVTSGKQMTDAALGELANNFLKEHRFDLNQSEFLSPFFKIGLIYQAGGEIHFTHPYLESYLVAQSLRENPSTAKEYFDPERETFNYYAFDLYCEMGPCSEVVSAVVSYANTTLQKAGSAYSDPHVYIETGRKIAALSNPGQLSSLASGLSSTAKKFERQDQDDDVRAEKQRLLDTRRHVRSEVRNRTPELREILPAEIATEFFVLDTLSRSLNLATITVGSGAEALDGEIKSTLAKLVVSLASKFSDVWTRNRLRIDFAETRAAILSDESIWQYVNDAGLNPDSIDEVRSELEIALHGAELNAILDPMGRVLWRVSSAAGVRVLAPILAELETDDPIERVMRASWMMDVDFLQGKDAMKAALNSYKGSALLRLVVANHLLWRVYWHHYRTVGSPYFVTEARRALGPLGLSPSEKRLEQVERGHTG